MHNCIYLPALQESDRISNSFQKSEGLKLYITFHKFNKNYEKKVKRIKRMVMSLYIGVGILYIEI